MNCKRCGQAIHGGLSVCPHCGERQTLKNNLVTCAHCRHKASSASSICPRCGYALRSNRFFGTLWSKVALALLALVLLGAVAAGWDAIRSNVQQQVARLGDGIGAVGGKVLDAASSLAVTEVELATSTPTPVVVLAELPEISATPDIVLAPTTVGAAVGGGLTVDQISDNAASALAQAVQPPTATAQPTATATPIPPTPQPTATQVPPTPTRIRPTATRVRPTATRAAPTATALPATATPQPATATPQAVAAAGGSASRSHTIQPGDNWFNVARRYGITQETLAAYNDMTPNDILQVDQVLQIPPEGAVVTIPTATATPVRPTPTRAAPTDTPTPAPTPTVLVFQPAPVLLAPSSGDGFVASAQPVVRWDYADLGPNDYYYVMLRFTKRDGSSGFAEDRTTSTSLAVPMWVFDMAAPPDRLVTWAVQIRRMGLDGQEIEISPFSDSRVFYWR